MAREVEERERDFWDHHVPSLSECEEQYRKGPDVYVRGMIEAVRPDEGKRILDFACGAGITTAWLAARGADVVGVDLSPVSIRRAEELRAALGLSYKAMVVGPKPSNLDFEDRFDGIVGRFALHHLDLSAYGRALARLLRPGGTAAFVETMATNPLLRFARNNLVGRMGVARLGTKDEHPLTHRDLADLQKTFGTIEVRTPAVTFFHLIDRQVLRGRHPRMTRYLNSLDRGLGRSDRMSFLSYYRLLVLRRTAVD